MIIIQDASTLFLTTKEVVFICCGAVSVALTVVTNNLTTKSKIKEVAMKAQNDYEKSDREIQNMGTQLKDIRDNFKELEVNIGNRLKEVSDGLNNMALSQKDVALSLANFKNDVLQMVYKEK